MELKESCMAPPVILLLIAIQREEVKTQHEQDKINVFIHKRPKYVCLTLVFSMDIITDVQVQVFDLKVMRGLTYVVGTEQPGHVCTWISCCGCLLGSHLLR